MFIPQKGTFDILSPMTQDLLTLRKREEDTGIPLKHTKIWWYFAFVASIIVLSAGTTVLVTCCIRNGFGKFRTSNSGGVRRWGWEFYPRQNGRGSDDEENGSRTEIGSSTTAGGRSGISLGSVRSGTTTASGFSETTAVTLTRTTTAESVVGGAERVVGATAGAGAGRGARAEGERRTRDGWADEFQKEIDALKMARCRMLGCSGSCGEHVGLRPPRIPNQSPGFRNPTPVGEEEEEGGNQGVELDRPRFVYDAVAADRNFLPQAWPTASPLLMPQNPPRLIFPRSPAPPPAPSPRVSDEGLYEMRLRAAYAPRLTSPWSLTFSPNSPPAIGQRHPDEDPIPEQERDSQRITPPRSPAPPPAPSPPSVTDSSIGDSRSASALGTPTDSPPMSPQSPEVFQLHHGGDSGRTTPTVTIRQPRAIYPQVHIPYAPSPPISDTGSSVSYRSLGSALDSPSDDDEGVELWCTGNSRGEGHGLHPRFREPDSQNESDVESERAETPHGFPDPAYSPTSSIAQSDGGSRIRRNPWVGEGQVPEASNLGVGNNQAYSNPPGGSGWARVVWGNGSMSSTTANVNGAMHHNPHHHHRYQHSEISNPVSPLTHNHNISTSSSYFDSLNSPLDMDTDTDTVGHYPSPPNTPPSINAPNLDNNASLSNPLTRSKTRSSQALNEVRGLGIIDMGELPEGSLSSRFGGNGVGGSRYGRTGSPSSLAGSDFSNRSKVTIIHANA